MKVLGVRPRDIYINFEISLTNVKQLKAFLDKAVISPESDLEEAGTSYVEEIIEPMLKEIIEEYGNGS